MYDVHRNIMDNYMKWESDVAGETAGRLTKHDLTAVLHLGDVRECTMTELAGKLKLSVSSATIVVDHLEEEGLAQRARSRPDRRVVRVSLTKEGLTICKTIQEMLKETIIAMLETLNEREQETFVRLSTKIRAGLSANP
jgi:DNA-binding MarR family transcriptional regulator